MTAVERRARTLAGIPLLSALSRRDLLVLARIARPRKYRRHDTIITAEEPGTAFFLLTAGVLRVSAEGTRGRGAALGLLYPYEFFGEMALLDGLPRSATVTALTDSEVLVIPRSTFLRCIREAPGLAATMIVTLSMRLRSADEKVRSLMFVPAPRRVARTLLDLTRGREPVDGTLTVTLPFTRRELAEVAGVSRETFTRIVARLSRAAVVRLEGRSLTVLDRARLASM